MARRAVFDPSDRDVFNEQRQRFDWSLLQNGFVYRYDTRFQLDSACERLTDLGYLVHRIEAHDWASIGDMHAAFAAEMSFPAYYGRNLDAFDDVLGDVATFDYGSDSDSTGTVLAIASYDQLVQLDRRTAKVVLDIFAKQARLAPCTAIRCCAWSNRLRPTSDRSAASTCPRAARGTVNRIRRGPST
ncbi:barstar family protein [Rhodococcus sp. NCIMB 12038]|uniref:barstar family protein n=1 Tax=Rhodococcus sp. NCIMB 12038 TaxID=933800 RepID=UPI00277D0F15|nr:barstar family protein [Rhodococcus sp. NCIMB 12038]